MMRGRHVTVAVALLAGAATAGVAIPGAEAADPPACTSPASGGDWTSYGHDLSNTRSQPDGSTVGLLEAPTVVPSFVYAASGTVNNTPLVSGGCVFVAAPDGSNAGRIVALDAVTGAELWATRISIGTAAYAGPIVGSPALHGDLLIVPMNKRAAPFLVALNRSTGAEVWRSSAIDTQPSSGFNASAVVYDGLVFMGFFGAAGPGAVERGGFAVLDAGTGQILEKTYSIPDHGTPGDPSDQGFEDGYGGAGIWATAAVDEATGFAYAGTSNPHTAQRIHPRSTSILKIDLNRTSPTFGEIVDSYQGLRDTLVPGLEDNAACHTKPDVYYYSSFSLTCFAIDVDFGASPNLIRTADGRTLVGNLQKAGVYHLVDTADMTAVSATPAGPPCFACNAASSAFAGGRAFVAAGPPGQLVAVDTTVGAPVWAGHLTGALTYNSVSVANGVVWTVDSGGFLDAFDALTGVQIVKRPLRVDTGVSMTAVTSSSGVAIAEGALFVAATRYVIAYRVPA